MTHAGDLENFIIIEIEIIEGVIQKMDEILWDNYYSAIQTYQIFKSMNYFSAPEFYSNYLAAYFTDKFEPMCKENHSGCIDDIDASWNIFVVVDHFIGFMSSLGLDQESLKLTLKQNFIIPIEDIQPDRIQNSLANQSIATIIVNGLNQSSVPVVQLMLRLYQVEVCGMGETRYEDLNRLVSDARMKANHLDWNYFPKLIKYVLTMCLKRCKTKSHLKVYRNLLDQNDLLDSFEDEIQQTNARINELRNRSAKKEVEENVDEEREENKKLATQHELKIQTTPKKKYPPKSPKKLKQNFNIRQYMTDTVIPTTRSAEKSVITGSLNRSNGLPGRTLNQISKKKFIPKKTYKYMNTDSTITSPTSLRNRTLQVSMKRSHSSLFIPDLHHEEEFNGNCLVEQTPILRSKVSMPQTTYKLESNLPLNFDISPKKKHKKL